MLKVFEVVTSANTNDTLQAVQTEEAPKLAAHTDSIVLNDELDEADKTRLRALNRDESMLAINFRNRLLAAPKASVFVTEQFADLDGLSDTDIAAAFEAATERNWAGAWGLPLQNTTQQAAQSSLHRRVVRQRLANFPKPAAGQAALHSVDDVTTMFHEFGSSCPPDSSSPCRWLVCRLR